MESHAPESANASNEINSIAEQSKKIMRENAMRYQNERLASLKKQNRKTAEPGTAQSVFAERDTQHSKPERSVTAPISSVNSESYQSVIDAPPSDLSVTSEDSNISNAGQNILDELSYSLARHS